MAAFLAALAPALLAAGKTAGTAALTGMATRMGNNLMGGQQPQGFGALMGQTQGLPMIGYQQPYGGYHY